MVIEKEVNQHESGFFEDDDSRERHRRSTMVNHCLRRSINEVSSDTGECDRRSDICENSDDREEASRCQNDEGKIFHDSVVTNLS